MSDDNQPKKDVTPVSSEQKKTSAPISSEQLNDSVSALSEQEQKTASASANQKQDNITIPADEKQDSASASADTKHDATPFASESEDTDSITDSRKTQVVRRPRNLVDGDSGPTMFSFDKTTTQPKDKTDPGRDTAVLSRDNPMLRRALHQHTSSASSMPNGTTSLGETREVILLIRGMVERIVMQEHRVYKLGRFEMATKGDDEVDLTPYGAQDRGVSRIHAQLHLADSKLYITDLGSTNGTYLSGTRLDPNEPNVLRKGDELLLGRLAVQVLFR